MKQIADNPYAKRLEAAMKRHLAHPEHEEPTFRCPECQDVLFVKGADGGYRPCMWRRCPAWDDVRAECDRLRASTQTKRRKVKNDDLPF